MTTEHVTTEHVTTEQFRQPSEPLDSEQPRPTNRASRRREQRKQKSRAKSGGRGLGRGLDSLIPGAASPESGPTQLSAPIGAIAPNPSQPRQEFDPEQLQELAASISRHGVLQPLLVRPQETGRYQLIAGERRWRAAGLAGLETVPIVIQAAAAEAEERLTLALVENLQRADLNPIELATAFEQLAQSGWTQERIATQVGKSRAAVANLLRLRRLPDPIQRLVASGALSEGHARALLAAPESQQSSLAEQAIESGWTVRQIEQKIKTATETAPPRPAARLTVPPTPTMSNAVKRLESALGTRVEVRSGPLGPLTGGRIVIHWYDEEQLAALTAQLTGLLPDQSADAEEFGI